jgi:hypothetical protein
MRILLTAEGESDEIVAARLVQNVFPDAEIQPKRLPARGIVVVRRLLTDIVRAAHFGHFELLVVHFDLDDTFLDVHQQVGESERWLAMRNEVDDLLTKLLTNTAGRKAPLHVVFMTPAQSTDAWLRWAVLNRDGKRWESKGRHTLKRELYGNPPRGLVRKCVAYVDRLIQQMVECGQWPRSLRDFQDAMEAFKKIVGGPGPSASEAQV